jgi:lysyl-tRNA synthetase class I
METFVNEKELESRDTYNVLARTVQRSYGKQSRITDSCFLGFTLKNDKDLLARVVTIFIYDSQKPREEQLKIERDIAFDALKDKLKELKEEYSKEREMVQGTTAKKIISFSASTEYQEEIQFSQTTIHANIKRAFYTIHIPIKMK